MSVRCVLLLIVFLSSVAQGADRIVLVAGTGTQPPGTKATQVKLDGPFGVDFDSQGRMFLVEISGHRVMQVDASGVLSLVGGTGEKGNAGDGGQAVKAQFNGMHSLAIGKDDAVYVADTWNNRVRRIDPKSGEITAFAGTGTKGDTGEGGPAVKADLGGIYCVAFDAPRENLYLVDLDNRKVKKVALATGVITTVAGNGKKGVPADESDAATSPLVDPRAVAVSPEGLVYVLERGGHALRTVDRDGKIRTVAGTGKAGLSGDDGPALQATLNGPKHLCVEDDESVLIADTENHAIRRYDPQSGKITRVAGSGKKGTAGLDGDPLQAELFQPHGVWIGPDKHIYVTDSGNHRVLRIERQAAVAAVDPVPLFGNPSVVVKDQALVQSAQFLPDNRGSLEAQWNSLWTQVQRGPDLAANPIRMHVTASSQAVFDELEGLLTRSFIGKDVAVTRVVSALPEAQFLVSLDVLSAAKRPVKQVELLAPDAALRCARAAVLPAGAKLFISGQAEKGDLPTATRLTLESLERTLQHHGRAKSDTVQVKAFVSPIAEAETVRTEIEAFFGAGKTPPVTLVEWESTLPIEIELVAWAGPAREGEPVEYLGAPGLNDSPVYCRVARVNHGPLIFTSGLHSQAGGSGEAEVTGIFTQLESILQTNGSDLKHLVKATYYLSQAEPSAKLNELRPRYYDPHRPPAASKAQVKGVGHAERGLTLDMIAVPRP